MKNVGILLDNLGASDLAFYAINRTYNKTDNNYILFYENLAKPVISPRCTVMNSSEIYGFNGVLIATNIDAAAKIIKAFAVEKKIFYIWDLDWLRVGSFDYEAMRNIYQHPELTVVARSNDHAYQIKRCWDINPKVIPNFNIEAIINAG